MKSIDRKKGKTGSIIAKQNRSKHHTYIVIIHSPQTGQSKNKIENSSEKLFR